MAGCLQKFLPQTYTTVADCQEKKGSVRTKIIAVIYTNSGKASLREGESRRWGELVSGRWEMGDGENFYLSVFFFLLPYSFFPIPEFPPLGGRGVDFFLLINWMAQHSAVEGQIQA
jgi:hypothetical protein